MREEDKIEWEEARVENWVINVDGIESRDSVYMSIAFL